MTTRVDSLRLGRLNISPQCEIAAASAWRFYDVKLLPPVVVLPVPKKKFFNSDGSSRQGMPRWFNSSFSSLTLLPLEYVMKGYERKTSRIYSTLAIPPCI